MTYCLQETQKILSNIVKNINVIFTWRVHLDHCVLTFSIYSHKNIKKETENLHT